MAKLSKARQAERAEAIEQLRGWLKPGDTVYTVLDRVSASGMSRIIRVVLLKCEDGTPRDLHPNWAVGTTLGIPHGKRNGRETEGLKIGGCGMDMGFHLVYELSSVLFRGGFGCIGKGCPSNDHSNGDRDYTPHDDGTPREASEVGTDIPGKRAHRHFHQEGGYALRQRWL